jgi:hypothetical protein
MDSTSNLTPGNLNFEVSSHLSADEPVPDFQPCPGSDGGRRPGPARRRARRGAGRCDEPCRRGSLQSSPGPRPCVRVEPTPPGGALVPPTPHPNAPPRRPRGAARSPPQRAGSRPLPAAFAIRHRPDPSRRLEAAAPPTTSAWASGSAGGSSRRAAADRSGDSGSSRIHGPGSGRPPPEPPPDPRRPPPRRP